MFTAKAVHTHRFRGLLPCFAACFREIWLFTHYTPWIETASWELLDIPWQEHVLRCSYGKAYSWIAISMSNRCFRLFTDLQLTRVRQCLRPESSSTLGEFTHTHAEGWVFKKDVTLSKPFTWVKLQNSLRKRLLKCRKNRNLADCDPTQ